MNRLNWVLAYWIIVMTGEINYIKQKQADVSMIADSVIEVIEIVWCQKTHSFVQIVIIISKIWLYVNEWCWDLCELEHRESTFKENSAICELLIWDDEIMFELVQKLIESQVAQLQINIVKLVIIHCASDVDDVDDDDVIVLDVFDVMQQSIVDERDEIDEIDIVVMNLVPVAQDIDVWFRDEREQQQIDWIDETDELDEIELEAVDEIIQDVQDLDDDEVDDDDISLEIDEDDEMLDTHQNEIWLQTDETDEMRESFEDDEIDDNEQRQIILAAIDELQNDEIDEIDECDETVEQLDDDDDDLIEENDDLDEIDETESFVDDVEQHQVLEVEANIDENDEVHSIICIDWFFTLVNISTIAFKQNDETDELDEAHHTPQLLEHHDDDIDESDEMVLIDEMFQLRMWNLFKLET